MDTTFIDFQRENDKILDEWEEASLHNIEDKDLVFVRDGLMFRGAIFYEDDVWWRTPANESQLWNDVFPRIMLITKDFNDPEGNTSDLRHETLRTNFTGPDSIITSQYPFHKNLMFHVYGLGNYKNGKCPLWDNLKYDICREFYETYPLVRINVKKQSGGGKVLDSVISKYIYRYEDYLNRQIRLFDADIIICYGRVIFNHVINTFFPDIEKDPDDPWVYFSEEQQKVIINSYHPSVRPRTISEKEYYSKPMKEFEQMMLKHKAFAAKYQK